MKTDVYEFVIDLFCGAGGTSTGIFLSETNSRVVFCVNHDHNAIESHRRNHPNAKHMIEDIRNPEVLFFLKLRVAALRKKYPNCVITIWASLECTNFSKAKGGLPRDADSRTLADYLPMYLEAVNPDYLMIENVTEFMSWGPLDSKGKPISKREGSDYLRWIEKIKSYGYRYDYRELNSANYGAFTARNRFFAQFAKGSLPISWPEPTHVKKVEVRNDLFGSTPFKQWRAVREILDLQDEGNSIFNRKKDLVDKTLHRIYAGLLKFVANGDESFIMKYFSGRPEGKVISVDGPAGTVRTADGQAYVNCSFILKYNSVSQKGVHVPPSVDEPCPTIAVQNRLGLTTVNFLQSYYGNGAAHSENAPCPTISTKDRFAKINTQFIDQQYGKSKPLSVNNPVGAITNNPKFALVNSSYLMPTSYNNTPKSIDEPCPTVLAGRKHHYIINPQYSSAGSSVDVPCPVIIARQDKRPLGLISCVVNPEQPFLIPIYDTDTDIMVKIKKLMAYFGITDIKMRMLKVIELKQIQGFPVDYVLIGNQTEQKKFIGNSVEVTTAKVLFEAHYNSLIEYFTKLRMSA